MHARTNVGNSGRWIGGSKAGFNGTQIVAHIYAGNGDLICVAIEKLYLGRLRAICFDIRT